MKTQPKHVIAAILQKSGLLSLLERLDKQPPNTLRALCYHRVDTPQHRRYLTPSLLSATPDEFAKQMQFVSKNYHIISIEQLVAALNGVQTLPPRAMLITFDDGYQDFKESAWPILKSLGLPAVLFASTAYLNDDSLPYWWDALYQMVVGTEVQEITVDGVGTLNLTGETSRQDTHKRLKAHLAKLGSTERALCLTQLQHATKIVPQRGDSLLTWSDLDVMVKEGLAVAPHTHTHTIMTRLSLDQLPYESTICRKLIRHQLGQAWPIFCYPNGKPGTFNQTTRRILQENGYIGAFTTLWGGNVLGKTHPLEMRRIVVGLGTPLGQLRYQLTGYYWTQRKLTGRL